jgi:hypothetical protein
VHNRPPSQHHRGSCLCEDYELRITERCLSNDLNLERTTEFSAATAHPIVQAFETQRSTNPRGGKTVGPAAGEHTIYRLGHGNDHRGATWFDEHNRVIWLCAYRLHRSGEVDDAFPYFHELIRSGNIWPREDDYEALFLDRDRRFVETLPQDAQMLLARARFNPGLEQTGVVGGEETTGVLVEVVETLEETYVVFSLAQKDYTRIVLILEAFYPNHTFNDWELVAALPTRTLRQNEACYRILHG